MFVDTAKIYIKAGDGGNGAVSFRRKNMNLKADQMVGMGKWWKYSICCRYGKNTLIDFRYKKHFKAQHGQNGQSKNRIGKNGEDLIIPVPPGTIIRDAESGRILADLTKPDDRRILARGGRGGKGNARFATATRQAPRFAQEGQKGEELWVILELKSIADVGLVGFPNVGKSTILSILTSARPKIDNYPFTTLHPNLGVVKTSYGKSFIMADIPGIIEGAHKGVGLGHDFLRHIERTRILIHVIDASGSEGRDPVNDFYVICKEIEAFSPELAKRPHIVAANKMDIPSSEENIKRLKKELNAIGIKVFPVSAATNKGFDELLRELVKLLDELPPIESFEEEADVTDMIVEQEPFEIQLEDGVFVVSGPEVDRLLGRVNLDDYESLQYFQRMLRRRGIIDALREKGIQNGDTVRMNDLEFEFID